MSIVFNSSPLIFLTKPSLLEKFIDSADNFYVPRSVFEEIDAKQDEACQFVKQLVGANKLQVQSSNLTSLSCCKLESAGRNWRIRSDRAWNRAKR